LQFPSGGRWKKTFSHKVLYQWSISGPSKWRIGIMLMEAQLTLKMVSLNSHPHYVDYYKRAHQHRLQKTFTSGLEQCYITNGSARSHNHHLLWTSGCDLLKKNYTGPTPPPPNYPIDAATRYPSTTHWGSSFHTYVMAQPPHSRVTMPWGSGRDNSPWRRICPTAMLGTTHWRRPGPHYCC
jgi:hypothetical protein